MLSEQNREMLRQFVARGDRHEPFKFVGREEIFKDVEEQLRQTREIGKNFQNTRVIQGPPGSGKTSILRELARRYAGTTVVPVMLSGTDLSNKITIAERLISSCGFHPRALYEKSTRKIAGDIGVGGLGLSLEINTQGRLPIEELEGQTPVWSVLSRCIKMPEEIIFLVLVDEAQRAQGTKHSQESELAIHLADGDTGHLKTLTVFGGLLSTSLRLAELGASSRLVSRGLRRVSSLEPGDVQELVEAFLNHAPFGLDVLDIDRQPIVDTVVNASDCYPRHVHAYLSGLAEEFATQQDISIDRALDTGKHMRVDFYKELFGYAESPEYTKTLTQIARGTGSNEPFTLEHIWRTAQEFGMTQEDFKETHKWIVHCGIIHETTDSNPSNPSFEFSVPSLRTYVLTGCDRAQTLELLREKEVSSQQNLIKP